MKILIIDDNKDITEMLCKFFTAKDHECTLSNDGKNGLTMIENQKFDVVLLDLAIPDFSGKKIIDSLHKNGKIKNQKIVLFTASPTSQKEIDDMIEKGAHSHIKKPIDPDVLIDYLSTLK